MKTLKWIAWISLGIGVLFVLMGIIQSIFGQFLRGSHLINYFIAGDSFFLITIALFIYLYKCECKK
jgi:hypothetical protein